MSVIYRLDNNKSQKLNWEKLDNGAYRAFITLGVADMSLEYVDFKGNKHTETITSDELFKADSLSSAYGLPICLAHPKKGIYANNQEGVLIGHTLESFINQDNKLLMPCVIDDHRGIKLIDSMIEKGTYAEVSPGYFVEKLKQDNNNQYLQIGRRYDHIALLESGEGRGGQAVVLRTDSNINLDMAVSTSLNTCVEQVTTSYEDDTTTVQKNCVETSVNTEEYGETVYTEEIEVITQKTMKISWKDKEYTEPSALVADANIMLDSKENRIQELETELANSKAIATAKTKDLEAANGRLDALQIQLDSKTNLITLDAANSRVKECIGLWDKVVPIFKQDNKDFQPDYSLSPTEIKQVYITQYQPKIKLDGKSEEYVNAVWDTISVNLDTLLADKIRTDAKDKVQNQLTQLQTAEILNNDSLEVDETAKALAELNARVLSAHK